MFLYDTHALVSVGTRECASAEWSTGVLVDQQGVVIKRLTLSMLHQSNQRDPQRHPPPHQPPPIHTPVVYLADTFNTLSPPLSPLSSLGHAFPVSLTQTHAHLLHKIDATVALLHHIYAPV